MANDATRRRKATGRAAATFLGIPHYVFNSPEFGELDGWALKLLVEIAGGYNGNNNGNLSCAWSVLRERGWRSTGTLWKSLRRLLVNGWIITTRHGSRNRCALYAVTWWPVDECPGKGLEIAATKSPANAWQRSKNKNAARNAESMRPLCEVQTQKTGEK